MLLIDRLLHLSIIVNKLILVNIHCTVVLPSDIYRVSYL